MPSSSSINVASSVRILDFPLESELWTAANYYSSSSNFQKQFEMMMNGVRCKKNFENWLKNEEV
jgi:hypothetical protein